MHFTCLHFHPQPVPLDRPRQKPEAGAWVTSSMEVFLLPRFTTGQGRMTSRAGGTEGEEPAWSLVSSCQQIVGMASELLNRAFKLLTIWERGSVSVTDASQASYDVWSTLSPPFCQEQGDLTRFCCTHCSKKRGVLWPNTVIKRDQELKIPSA